MSSAINCRRLLSTLVLIVATGYLYVIIPKGFFPEQDTGFIFGQADAREDSSFKAMASIVQKIVEIVRHDPAVSGVFAFTGANAFNPTENTARVFIQLVPHDQRDRKPPARSSDACAPRWPRSKASNSSCSPGRTSASAGA